MTACGFKGCPLPLIRQGEEAYCLHHGTRNLAEPLPLLGTGRGRPKANYTCADCGGPVSTRSTTRCAACYAKHQVAAKA